MKKPEIVSLCSGGNCCPDACFSEDKSIVLEENGQVIYLSESAATLLAEALRERGYLGK